MFVKYILIAKSLINQYKYTYCLQWRTQRFCIGEGNQNHTYLYLYQRQRALVRQKCSFTGPPKIYSDPLPPQIHLTLDQSGFVGGWIHWIRMVLKDRWIRMDWGKEHFYPTSTFFFFLLINTVTFIHTFLISLIFQPVQILYDKCIKSYQKNPSTWMMGEFKHHNPLPVKTPMVI